MENIKKISSRSLVIQSKLFNSMVHSVWITLTFYVGICYYLDAPLALFVGLLGVIFLCPLILILEQKKYQQSARIFFSLSCYLYIFAVSPGFKHQIYAEYYYLPAIIIPLILFDHERFKLILSLIIAGVFLWGHSIIIGSDFIPEKLLATEFPSVLRHINFFGASILLAIFVNFTREIKRSMLKEVEKESDKLELIMKSMSEGLLVLNEHDDVISQNPAFCKILGLPTGGYKGKHRRNSELRHCHDDGTPYLPEDHPSRVAFRTNEPQLDKVMGLVLPHKGLIWLKINAVPFEDEGRRHVVMTLADITEQKNAELKNAQILNAIDSTAIVACTDLSGRITRVNENFCKISGYMEEELLGRDHRIINSGYHSKQFFSKLWNTIKQGHSWAGNICNRAKNGKLYHVETAIAPIKDFNGEIVEYMSIRFDVSEQKKMEGQLSEAQSIAKIGSFQYNLTTNQQEWSQEQYKICEMVEESSDLLYFHYRSKIHQEDLPQFDKLFERAHLYGEDFVLNHRIHFDKEKRVKYVRVIGKVTKDPNGRAISISGTCQDLTEEVQKQKELEVAKAMSIHNAKLASLGEMSAGIAHEINNPLGVIIGNIEMLNEFKDNPEKFDSKINSIARAAERIEKIVKGLRKFSRSTDHYTRSIENLSSIVNEAIIMTEHKSKRHNVKLEVHVEPNLEILCDGVEIEQVLVNLISNAIDAVKMHAECWVKVNGFNIDNTVVLQVMDSGFLSEGVEEKLFQPFFTTKVVGEGTGLGLSIVKGILEQHGATINLNRSFINTCFEIKFPEAGKAQNVA